MKKTLPFKTIKKKFALVDTRPDLYLILRFLCVPLEARVPHFENYCYNELISMPSPPVKAEATHHVLKTAGGGFRRDVEQAPDDNQSGGDA